MDSYLLLNISEWLQSALIFVVVFANFPQWIKLVKTKSSADFSISTWVLYLVCSLISVFYAIMSQIVHGSSGSLLFSTSSNLIANVVTMFLILKYRRFDQRLISIYKRDHRYSHIESINFGTPYEVDVYDSREIS